MATNSPGATSNDTCSSAATWTSPDLNTRLTSSTRRPSGWPRRSQVSPLIDAAERAGRTSGTTNGSSSGSGVGGAGCRGVTRVDEIGGGGVAGRRGVTRVDEIGGGGGGGSSDGGPWACRAVGGVVGRVGRSGSGPG